MNPLIRLIQYLTSVAVRLAGMEIDGPFRPVTDYPVRSATHAEDTLEWFQGAFARDVKGSFDNSRTPDGTPYAPLKYRVGQPLVLSGDLMRSAVDAARHSTLLGREVMAEISEPKYWRYHEYGTVRIPARSYFYPGPETLAELNDRAAAEAADKAVS